MEARILLEGTGRVASSGALGDVFDRCKESPHVFSTRKLSKTICLKPAVPLFWCFWLVTSNIYFYLTSLAFTKYSDLFHWRERSWLIKQSYEHQNLNVTWTVWSHRESGCPLVTIGRFIFKLIPCSALLFMSKCFSLLCLSRHPNNLIMSSVGEFGKQNQCQYISPNPACASKRKSGFKCGGPARVPPGVPSGACIRAHPARQPGVTRYGA